MRITHLAISNYRALREVEVPLSRFACLIGENNAGKSTFLQAISLFFSGSKLPSNNFFDQTKPIRIAITFDNITEADLARLFDEHRARVRPLVTNGRLTLVRLYGTDGKSSLLYNAMTPTEERFSADSIAALVKGQRPGPTFVGKVVKAFPELDGTVDPSMNQDAVVLKIKEYADTLPENEKAPSDLPLPTGFDRSIDPMLPTPIYIPAVKDLSDDIKTTESAPFGKIISILLQSIEPHLPDAKELFDKLNTKLNRVQHADGTETDNRLDQVKLIESTVEQYLQESFSDVLVRIAIPPPELKAVLSSAQIYADDGISGLIDTKGDGLRRAIVFSILRSYVDLKARLDPDNQSEQQVPPSDKEPKPTVDPAPPSYILLFEEPELFLHPKAQHILFNALRLFSKDHHVVVTTHSPMFFGPEATETFIKLRKIRDGSIAARPFTHAQPVDFKDINAKDQFQIICFENNNAAFFADTVVLVEGDSDYVLMPHIAKTLDPAWDIDLVPVRFCRITGKGNIKRYRDFFSRFDVRVPVIADLDLLISGFQHISPSNDLKQARDDLLFAVDELIVPDEDGPSSSEAKRAHNSGELRGLWRRVCEFRTRLAAGECSQEDHDQAVEDFFAWQRKSDRLAILQNSDDADMLRLKHRLLAMLRDEDVYVLERGAIEQYYPASVTGTDKPSQAREFCNNVTTRSGVLDCCGEQEFSQDGVAKKEKEFLLIFSRIFQ